MQRDPRITVLIPGDHPWDYAEVRGHIVDTVGGQEARDHIGFLGRKYLGADSYPNPVGPEGRVILKIAADKVNARAGQDQRLIAHDDGPINRPRSDRAVVMWGLSRVSGPKPAEPSAKGGQHHAVVDGRV